MIGGRGLALMSKEEGTGLEKVMHNFPFSSLRPLGLSKRAEWQR